MHWSFALLQPEHTGTVLSHFIFLRTQVWQLKRIVATLGLGLFWTVTGGVRTGAGAIGTRCEGAILTSMIWYR